MRILIPTTSAVTAGNIDHFRVGDFPVTLSADALAGSEEVDIQYRADPKAAWAVAYDYDGAAAIKLTATTPQVVLKGSGEYRCAKDATASACGLYVSAARKPEAKEV